MFTVFTLKHIFLSRDNPIDFITEALFSKIMPLIAAATICMINNIETNSTAIDTPKYTFLILVWVFMDDDNVNDKMIM